MNVRQTHVMGPMHFASIMMEAFTVIVILDTQEMGISVQVNVIIANDCLTPCFKSHKC